MQKLYWESAWDKTIAPKDREKITTYFYQQIPHLRDEVHLAFYRKAINHKNELLITVLIHNPREVALHLKDVGITFLEAGQKIASGNFNVPVEIDKHTSMPWTFIFPPTNDAAVSSEYTIEKI